ncbi:hypothetical protein MMC10_000798 [Thelotrema lepadinum]|nr:hypothetical protein [Thelotrema lepadinum]
MNTKSIPHGYKLHMRRYLYERSEPTLDEFRARYYTEPHKHYKRDNKLREWLGNCLNCGYSKLIGVDQGRNGQESPEIIYQLPLKAVSHPRDSNPQPAWKRIELPPARASQSSFQTPRSTTQHSTPQHSTPKSPQSPLHNGHPSLRKDSPTSPKLTHHQQKQETNRRQQILSPRPRPALLKQSSLPLPANLQNVEPKWLDELAPAPGKDHRHFTPKMATIKSQSDKSSKSGGGSGGAGENSDYRPVGGERE